MKCNSCGAEIKENAKFCECCGSQISYEMRREQEQLNKVGCPKCGSSNITFNREKQGEIKVKNSSAVIRATIGLCKDCGYTWSTTDNVKKNKKDNNMIWWVLGWIFFFPAPVMILIWRKQCTWDTKVKISVTIAFWVLLFIIGYTNQGKTTTIDNNQIETENIENTSKIESELEIQKDNNLSTTEIKEADTDITKSQEKGHRDESLKGRGHSDIGRSEPDYIGVIGYVADYFSYDIRNSSKFAEEQWTVPIYEKDKQFYNEIGNINHKTEVLVLEQKLEHTGYGNYKGYLTVEDTQIGEQYIINVSNFITKPYWTYDITEAAKIGYCIAEFNQVSDYYPVDKNNKKAELDDGTIVLVIGTTGLYGKGGPDKNTNQIEAVVFKEWKYGFGGVSIYFNTDDLTITY